MLFQDLPKGCHIFILLVVGVFCFAAAPVRMIIKPLYELDESMLVERITTNLNYVSIYKDGLRSTLVFMIPSLEKLRPEATHKVSISPRKAKEDVWNVWKSLLDYYMATESIRSYYRRFYKVKDKERWADSFLVYYASFLSQYRFALEFLEKGDAYPELDTILNDPVPELGLPGKTYSKFKFHFLNVARALELKPCRFKTRALITKAFSLDGFGG